MDMTIARGETVAIRAYAEHMQVLVKEAMERRLKEKGCFDAIQSDMHYEAVVLANVCDQLAEHFELEPACVSVTLDPNCFGKFTPDYIRYGKTFDWREWYARTA